MSEQIIEVPYDKCYDINSKLIQNNKYKRVEGSIYTSGYAQSSLTTTSAQIGVSNPTLRWKIWGYKKYSQVAVLYTWEGYEFKLYYTTNALPTVTTSQVISTTPSDFGMTLTGTAIRPDTTTFSFNREAHYGNDFPVLKTPYTPANDLASHKTMLENSDWLGYTMFTIGSATQSSVQINSKTIVKVEIYAFKRKYYVMDDTLYSDETTLEATYTIDDDITFTPIASSYYADKSEYTAGATARDYVLKYQDCKLLQTGSTYTVSGVAQDLTSYVFSRILSNYDRGKQTVTFECALDDYEDTAGTSLTDLIFEPGQYIKLIDGTGSSLFYYKTTSIDKIFEICDVEFTQERWRIKAKEVARIELN